MTAITDLMLVLGGALWCAIPLFSRPSVFFGVTAAPGFSSSDEGRMILSRYRTSVAGMTLAAVAIVHLVQWARPGLGVAAGVFFQMIACLSLWVKTSRQARSFAVPSPPARTVSLEPRAPSLPGGWLFFLGPLIILAIAAWFLQSNWNSIPERFPIHWGLDGKPDGWAMRSFGGVYGMLLLGFWIGITMLVMAYAIIFRTRQVSASGPSADRERAFKRNTYLIIMLCLYMASLVFAGLAMRPALASRPNEMGSEFETIILISMLISIACVVYALRGGQGGARLTKPTETIPSGDGTPDECWKLGGQFYYNPNDPAWLVERRVGYGFTFNLANRWSWIFLAALLAAPPIVILLIR